MMTLYINLHICSSNRFRSIGKAFGNRSNNRKNKEYKMEIPKVIVTLVTLGHIQKRQI